MKGRTALVTGATGVSGRVVALLLANEGCDLVLACHPSDENTCKALTEHIVNKYKRKCYYKTGDMSKREYANELISFTMSKFDRLDCIAHLAKVWNPKGTPIGTADSLHSTATTRTRSPTGTRTTSSTASTSAPSLSSP